MGAERWEIQARRRRGIILKLVREGHENQMSRMDDFELWAILLKMGQTVGRQQVVTLLQDLQVLDYLGLQIDRGRRIRARPIEPDCAHRAGLRFCTRRQSNDDVLFN